MRKATPLEEILKHLLCEELDDDGFLEDAIADRSIGMFRDFLETIDDLNEVNSLTAFRVSFFWRKNLPSPFYRRT